MDKIKAELKEFSRQIGALEQLHKRALIAVDAEDAGMMGKQVDAIAGDLNRRAVLIRNAIACLSEDSDRRLSATQQKKLGKAFLEAVRSFEDVQNKYKALYRQHLERQYRIVYPEASQADIEALDQDSSQSVFISTLHMPIA